MRTHNRKRSKVSKSFALQIVETMSFTGEVSEFIKTLGPTFYEYVDESDDESTIVKEKEDSGIEADCKLDNEVLAIMNQKPTDDNYYSDDSSVDSGSVETVQLGQRRVSGSSVEEYHDPLTEVKTSRFSKVDVIHTYQLITVSQNVRGTKDLARSPAKF